MLQHVLPYGAAIVARSRGRGEDATRRTFLWRSASWYLIGKVKLQQEMWQSYGL